MTPLNRLRKSAALWSLSKLFSAGIVPSEPCCAKTVFAFASGEVGNLSNSGAIRGTGDGEAGRTVEEAESVRQHDDNEIPIRRSEMINHAATAPGWLWLAVVTVFPIASCRATQSDRRAWRTQPRTLQFLAPRFLSLVCAGSFGVLATTSAASEVTFTLRSNRVDDTGGFFRLDVQASEESGGIAGIAVDLEGIDVATPIEPHVGLEDFRILGFLLYDAIELTDSFFTSQAILSPESVIFGVGKTSDPPVIPSPFSGFNIPWVTPTPMLYGRHNRADGPQFGNDVNATLFVSEGSIDVFGSQSFPILPIAPPDHNQGGNVDVDDFELWNDNYGMTGASQSDGDANGNQTVDGHDHLLWQAMYPTVEYGGTALTGEVEIHLEIDNRGLAADFDRDGDVDGSDFLVWQLAFARGFDASGDANLDRVTSADDFLIWQEQFGLLSPLSAIQVPECSSQGLILILCALLANRMVWPVDLFA